jgi:GT2 family glycosyltransferase
MTVPAADVAVVVCAYTMERVEDLEACMRGLAAQTLTPSEVVMVVDHNEELLAWAGQTLPATLPGLRVVFSAGRQGLSGARNSGVASTSAAVVAFLDDDAVPEPAWLAELVAPFAEADVMGTGGRVRPAWPDRRPSWFPEEFDWVVGASYVGLPTEAADLRNPIGASMAFRREAILLGGGFREGLGRIGRKPLGCEETELSIRIHQAEPTARVRYAPDSVVDHRVSPDRVTFRYFWRRCVAEGNSKAAVAAEVGASSSLSSETAYVKKVLPAGVGLALRDVRAGRLSGAGRATAIVGGAGATAWGYGSEVARRRLARSVPSRPGS